MAPMCSIQFRKAAAPTGRPAVAGKLSREAKDFLKRSALQCGSKQLSLYHFANDPLCPDELRDRFLEGGPIPLSLRRAMHLTEDAKAQYRGPQAVSHTGYQCSHDGSVIDPASGERRPLLAGDIFLSDDMSRNIPFWFELPPGDRETRARRGDRLAERHGVAVGRQGLFTTDARGKLLGFSLVGCARDAYTAADVLRHFWNVVNDWGFPRLQWVLEKGVWRSHCIDGSTVWCPEQERERMVSSLGELGFDLCHVSTSQGKALIEGWFHFFQKVQSLQKGAPDIGRTRGEMEREAKLMNRIQQGTVHPAAAGLPTLEEAMAMDLKAGQFCNGKRKDGRIQNGIPDEVWIRDTRARPMTRPSPEQRGHFLPTKIETRIRGGHVSKKIERDLFRFTLPETFAECGADYRVMMAFDPTDPESGAEIFNLETGSKNIRGWKFMEHMGTAEYCPARPLYGYSDEVSDDVARRKRYQRAVKTAYAGTGIFGRRASWSVEQRDGRGNVDRVEISSSAAAERACRPRSEPGPPPFPRSPAAAPILGTGRGVDEPRSRLARGVAPPGRAAPSRIKTLTELVGIEV